MDRRTATNIGLSTDLLLANLPEKGLQSVLRALVSFYPNIVPSLFSETTSYLLENYSGKNAIAKHNITSLADVEDVQKIARSFIGCRAWAEALGNLAQALEFCALAFEGTLSDQENAVLTSVDCDISQALSLAPQQNFTTAESEIILKLLAAFESLQDLHSFERSRVILTVYHPKFSATERLCTPKISVSPSRDNEKKIETFRIGERHVPRILCGLWQLSSSAWGSSSLSRIMRGFENHLRYGFTAFDMADIYGDTEIIYGEFRNRLEDPNSVFTATKYCTFHPGEDTSAQTQRFVSSSLRRLRADSIDLLQLHWADYSNCRYVDVLRVLRDINQVHYLGLCNFDANHMENVLHEGIDIKTNQVQFSLIDTRPTIKVALICEKYNVKLLAYGVLCGGFISETWLGRAAPNLFSDNINPSQRKYFEMIQAWGGWQLFQRLLTTLSSIATKHSVGISNVATRWVLDHSYVGAVIIGSRMGSSERMNDNMAVYGWRLDKEDRDSIEKVQLASRRSELLSEIGDCGSEHR